MKMFHKTPSLSMYLINSGFQSYKKRIVEELGATSDVNLEDYIDEDSLYGFYRSGESPDFIAARLGACCYE